MENRVVSFGANSLRLKEWKKVHVNVEIRFDLRGQKSSRERTLELYNSVCGSFEVTGMKTSVAKKWSR